MSRREKLVSTVLKYLGTKPSKKQVSVVVMLMVLSFGLGVALSDDVIQETAPEVEQPVNNTSQTSPDNSSIDNSTDQGLDNSSGNLTMVDPEPDGENTTNSTQ